MIVDIFKHPLTHLHFTPGLPHLLPQPGNLLLHPRQDLMPHTEAVPANGGEPRQELLVRLQRLPKLALLLQTLGQKPQVREPIRVVTVPVCELSVLRLVDEHVENALRLGEPPELREDLSVDRLRHQDGDVLLANVALSDLEPLPYYRLRLLVLTHARFQPGEVEHG